MLGAMKNRLCSLALLAISALAVGACASVSAASDPSGGPSTSTPVSAAPSGGDQDARDYCVAQGGQLVDRVATSNTNGDPSAQLQLAGRMTFCEFEEGSGDSTTRISVDLVTLSSTSPTLAAIAYLSRLPTVTAPPRANSASSTCPNGLGGTTAWGNDHVSGGWVDASQPVFTVMDECVFPDFSAIDAFGIFYYANGVVRGADLATKMRYQPDERGL